MSRDWATWSLRIVIASVMILLLPFGHLADVRAGERVRTRAQRDLLSSTEWKRLDDAIDRALSYLASRQSPDGAFTTAPVGQPAITSLCILAFLSRGHAPREGQYGAQLDRAIEYVLAQQQDNGLIFAMPIEPVWQGSKPSHTGIYNHAIAGLMLGDVYGMTESTQHERIAQAIKSAVRFTREQQERPKRTEFDKGGWRYLAGSPHLPNDSDLTVTAWQLMFLRSARNAEFDVPKEYMDEAMAYIRRSFNPSTGTFHYAQLAPETHHSRAVAGCGILALSLGGEHESEMARASGEWILKRPLDQYNRTENHHERYHYSAYHCSQGMFQLGGDYWTRFYPPMMRTLLDNQLGDGSWPAELREDYLGSVYSTSLAVLTLTPPYQLLPIFQR
ncbi:prenyltransferase/squalene oxidase repeat-containing protein [Schlesneria paludicola]|uniref:hypothetical protein n=1 Tax=Schlesneria paludicola TaxID=360056 RepID=UPI00029A2B44|nr:hypothetical protein [Schlesneria paludicola]